MGKQLDVADLDLEPTGSEGYLLGAVTIGGVHFHTEAIRVRRHPKTGEQVCASRDETARGIWEQMCAVDERGSFLTVKVPGHRGAWVIVIHPFMD